MVLLMFVLSVVGMLCFVRADATYDQQVCLSVVPAGYRPEVLRTAPTVRKLTPVTDRQRVRLHLLADYALAAKVR